MAMVRFFGNEAAKHFDETVDPRAVDSISAGTNAVYLDYRDEFSTTCVRDLVEHLVVSVFQKRGFGLF